MYISQECCILEMSFKALWTNSNDFHSFMSTITITKWYIEMFRYHLKKKVLLKIVSRVIQATSQWLQTELGSSLLRKTKNMQVHYRLVNVSLPRMQRSLGCSCLKTDILRLRSSTSAFCSTWLGTLTTPSSQTEVELFKEHFS